MYKKINQCETIFALLATVISLVFLPAPVRGVLARQKYCRVDNFVIIFFFIQFHFSNFVFQNFFCF